MGEMSISGGSRSWIMISQKNNIMIAGGQGQWQIEEPTSGFSEFGLTLLTPNFYLIWLLKQLFHHPASASTREGESWQQTKGQQVC